MNRRGFISLLAGAGGATLVPWRFDIARTIILPARIPLVQITGMQIRQLAVPEEWVEGPYQVNFDTAWIRADRKELLEAALIRRIEYVHARSGARILVRLS